MSDLFLIRADEAARHLWTVIQRDPTALSVIRDGVSLPPQTVRIASVTRSREPSGDRRDRIHAVRVVVIVGVVGHPANDVADLDLRRDDRFALDGGWCTVKDVQAIPGGVQASATLLA